MNAKQAKELDFPALLSKFGFEPVKVTKGGRELWYCSPFREEKDASFHTSFVNGKWIWNDFGDCGGNVIDFIMRYKNMNSFAQAMDYLRSLYPNMRPRAHDPGQGSLLSFRKANHKTREMLDGINEHDRSLEFIEAHPIKHPAIFQYLEHERKIPAALARLYLEEVKYWNKDKGKQFFAFGMKNESGGYEIRAASDNYTFKSALSARDISLIAGRGGEVDTVNVFEGMTDFLSLLVMLKTQRLQAPALVMHSVSSFSRAASHIHKCNYKTINTFLDNNKGGQKATNRFIETFGSSVFNRSPCFAPHTDLNDALRADHRFLPIPRTELTPRAIPKSA